MLQVSEGGRFLTQALLRPLSWPPFGWAGGPLGVTPHPAQRAGFSWHCWPASPGQGGISQCSDLAKFEEGQSCTGFIVTWASLVAQTLKDPPAMQKTWLQSLCWEDPLEKGMATHSSILAWRIPWAEEPDGLVYGVRHDWVTNISLDSFLLKLSTLSVHYLLNPR